jgi:hypothetical protein
VGGGADSFSVRGFGFVRVLFIFSVFLFPIQVSTLGISILGTYTICVADENELNGERIDVGTPKPACEHSMIPRA